MTSTVPVALTSILLVSSPTSPFAALMVTSPFPAVLSPIAEILVFVGSFVTSTRLPVATVRSTSPLVLTICPIPASPLTSVISTLPAAVASILVAF